MSDYWPWWAGAIGLAVITITYAVVTGRSFGVSSAWDRVVHWRTERHVERMEAQFADDRSLAEALAAATPEHVGPRAGASVPPLADAPDQVGPRAGASVPPRADAPEHGRHVGPTAGRNASVVGPRPAPLVSQAALLLSILIGGWLAAVTSGRFKVRFDMGDGFRELVTGNPAQMVGVLFVGGVLVGFGTRLAGGCSSGHGLNGCGRLHPVSILATAVFFGAAVGMSFLLWKVI